MGFRDIKSALRGSSGQSKRLFRLYCIGADIRRLRWKWQDSKYKSYFLSQAYWRGWVYSQQNKRDDYARYPDFQEAVYSHEKWLILIGSGYGKCKGNTQKDGIGESFAIQNI